MTDPAAAHESALHAALERLLGPLARLAVARGVPFAVVDEMLRAAFVATAHAAHPGLPEHRRTSRVSAATGLNRREVNRILAAKATAQGVQEAAEAAPAPPRSPAAMVFAHWRSDAAYRTRAGVPRVLPRTGPAPSFESLAHEVTRDVHPRALLEELLRLQLATHDTVRDTVALSREAFVPRGDMARMAQWMGANVGDHMQAAVANLLGRKPEYFEQAIAAQGLSAESVAQVRPLLQAHWQRLTEELVPLLERLIEQDAARTGSDNPNSHRVRLGLYGFDDAQDAHSPSVAPQPEEVRPAARKPSRKAKS
ncbi:MAG: DUF6502 family protein [Aquincola sp.]|nr:DUF6502 family protein [Aquincola sp.]MDH4287220.1 DUF6502 family protein [Aquincola sp.]MDH5328574.1 DUF6502 family protein [Aquincola sp.]